MELVRKTGAELLVAKLDRLNRKVSFIATLMDDKKVRLRVAAVPNADKFQLHIYAALAEAKARGTKLGGLRDKTGERNKAVQSYALQRAERVSGLIIPLRAQGRYPARDCSVPE